MFNESSRRSVSDLEIELLYRLNEPTALPTASREFANLRQLGLVFVQDKTGLAELTPLGKAWVSTQDLTALNR